jgi:hypothetical protein
MHRDQLPLGPKGKGRRIDNILEPAQDRIQIGQCATHILAEVGKALNAHGPGLASGLENFEPVVFQEHFVPSLWLHTKPRRRRRGRHYRGVVKPVPRRIQSSEQISALALLKP